jgi:hypothetical protein
MRPEARFFSESNVPRPCVAAGLLGQRLGSVTVVVLAPIRRLMELGRRGRRIDRLESFGFVIIDSLTLPDRDKK